mmetsp:Transcript_974/g.1976  ORF Transcript_974/g.1976 Transcript_974/m.1976 type:complete len:283 (+) Transcript_974:111-959(+)
MRQMANSRVGEQWDLESDGSEDFQDYGNEVPRRFSRTGKVAVYGGLTGAVLLIVAGCVLLYNGANGNTPTEPTGQWHQVPLTQPPPPVSPVAAVFNTTPPPVAIVVSTTEPLSPNENLGDGNFCNSDEELLQGLCYKKCKLLTNGTHPIRNSAMSCCRSRPCGFTNTKIGVGMCAGFDVSGDLESKGGCPHKPGACLTNEELSVGTCYKKCEILTNGTFPYRVTAVTCCKEKGIHCLAPQNMATGMTDTSPDYNVGGGKGDGNDATPSKAHTPLQHLTEATS